MSLVGRPSALDIYLKCIVRYEWYKHSLIGRDVSRDTVKNSFDTYLDAESSKKQVNAAVSLKKDFNKLSNRKTEFAPFHLEHRGASNILDENDLQNLKSF